MSTMHRICTAGYIPRWCLLLLLACLPSHPTYCGEVAKTSFQKNSPLSAFYYACYDNPEREKTVPLNENAVWGGWNTKMQPHWNERVNQMQPYKDLLAKRIAPPDDISVVYYPEDGPYSSHDLSTMQRQFAQMHASRAWGETIPFLNAVTNLERTWMTLAAGSLCKSRCLASSDTLNPHDEDHIFIECILLLCSIFFKFALRDWKSRRAARRIDYSVPHGTVLNLVKQPSTKKN